MTTLKKDKIIGLLASALLGYYLSISIFRHVVWQYLKLFLPPINDRHLPDLYPGLLGALLTIFLANLIFLKFLEKKPFKFHHKEYLITLALLLFSPLIIGGVFRFHAVSYVQGAEKTTPTEISIRLDTPANEIMFEVSKNSATGFRKNIIVPEESLAQFGKLIRTMQLQTTAQQPPSTEDETLATFWIDYEIKGKWYSKILTYHTNYFSEHVSNGKKAIYQSPELAQLIEELVIASNDLSLYTHAKIVNSQSIKNKEKQIHLTDQQLSDFLSNVKPEHKIEPTPHILARFKFLTTEEFIPQTETDIYAIELSEGSGATRGTENFMVYDKQTATLYFNSNYYKINSPLLPTLN